MAMLNPLQQKTQKLHNLQNFANDNLKFPATKTMKTTKSYKIMLMTISDPLQ